MKTATNLPLWDDKKNNANQKAMEAKFYPKVKSNYKHFSIDDHGFCKDCDQQIIN